MRFKSDGVAVVAIAEGQDARFYVHDFDVNAVYIGEVLRFSGLVKKVIDEVQAGNAAVMETYVRTREPKKITFPKMSHEIYGCQVEVIDGSLPPRVLGPAPPGSFLREGVAERTGRQPN